MKNLRIFWLFTTFSLKTTFQSPIGVTMFTLGKLIRFGMFFFFVFYLLSATKILAGYTLEQTILFYLTYSIIDSLAQLMFREVYRFRSLVVSGELDSVLVKPYHPFMKILLGGVDILDLGITLIYAGLATYYILQMSGITSLHVLLYIGLIINALIISTSFHIMVLALGILSTEVDHTIMIYRDMTRMGTFPIDIYGQPIRFFFTFVIPIGIMMTFPVKGLLDGLQIQTIAFSFLFSAVALGVSLSLWNFALKKYQSWGG